MTPREFQIAWERTEPSTPVRFPTEVVVDLPIPTEARSFLSEIGLPSEAAPFLDFGSRQTLSIPSVVDLWKIGDPRYCVIGSSVYGDPVCVDTSQAGRVVYLLHDEAMVVRFINSSVPQLAYSLLAFRTVVARTRAANGDDAFLDGMIPPELVDWFLTKMETIDPEAIATEHFWFRSIVGKGT